MGQGAVQRLVLARPKKFDFDVNQISITPERAKAVDFSAPYFTAPQAIVVPKGSKYAKRRRWPTSRTRSSACRSARRASTRSTSTIKPTQAPKVFNNSNDVVTALKENLVDAVAVDLPTAFYITAAQVEGSTIAGQFKAPGGD